MIHLPFGSRPALPVAARTALGLGRGEHVLASGTLPGGHLVVTTYRLVAVEEGQVTLDRPWHLVDGAGVHEGTPRLWVRWVDRAAPSEFDVTAGPRFHDALRERVQASVLAEHFVDVGVRQRRARVAIRTDLATGEHVEQAIVGRGSDASDPAVRAACEDALAVLREETGLD